MPVRNLVGGSLHFNNSRNPTLHRNTPDNEHTVKMKAIENGFCARCSRKLTSGAMALIYGRHCKFCAPPKKKKKKIKKKKKMEEKENTEKSPNVPAPPRDKCIVNEFLKNFIE